MLIRCKIDVEKEALKLKVQVNLSEELVEKIDGIAKSLGVSRSALCGVWIGQAVFSTEKAQSVMDSLLTNINKDKFNKNYGNSVVETNATKTE